MIDRTEAEDHLRVIRSLMEKATIYRAISAPSALFGGILAVITATVFCSWQTGQMPESGRMISGGCFVTAWLAVLVITGIANLWFIRREATLRGDAFVSTGMRMAILSLLPANIGAGAATVLLSTTAFWPLLSVVWTVCYGISLLGTQHFAPRSLIWLGWAFLCTGGLLTLALVFVPWERSSLWSESVDTAGYFANLMMGLTFGLFHLVYAGCTWPRKPKP